MSNINTIFFIKIRLITANMIFNVLKSHRLNLKKKQQNCKHLY